MATTGARPSKLRQKFRVPVTDPDTWHTMSLRERVRSWVSFQATSGGSFPLTFYLRIVPKLALYASMWHFGFRDHTADFFTEGNIRRWIVYNVINDVLGMGATSGPLGIRFTAPFQLWWYLITPGTVRTPLFQGSASAGPCVALRSWLHVGLYLAYVALLLRALLTCEATQGPSASQLLPAIATLGVLTVFDVVPAMASRIEHQGYMMLCLCFSDLVSTAPTAALPLLLGPAGAVPRWLFGCQIVQVALWTFSGTCKLGPWFTPVTLQLISNCVFFRPFAPRPPQPAAKATSPSPSPPPPPPVSPFWKVWFRDVGAGDLRPSRVTKAMAEGGAVTEALMGWICICPAHLQVAGVEVRMAGVVLTICFHCYILLMLPAASVYEWNIFTILMTWYLYGCHEFVGLDWIRAALSPANPQVVSSAALLAGLGVACCAVPVYGQLYPCRVPFMLAYRPYSGNWRFMYMLLVAREQGGGAAPQPSAPRKEDARRPSQSALAWAPVQGSTAAASPPAADEEGQDWASSAAKPAGWRGREEHLARLQGKVARLTTFESVFTDESVRGMFPGVTGAYAAQTEAMIHAMTMPWPSYRPVLSIAEALAASGAEGGAARMRVVFNEVLGNRVLGWVFGHGWLLWRRSFRQTMQHVCGFDPGECYFIQFEPIGLALTGRYEVEYRAVDVATGKVALSGRVPYSDLELPKHPCDFHLSCTDKGE